MGCEIKHLNTSSIKNSWPTPFTWLLYLFCTYLFIFLANDGLIMWKADVSLKWLHLNTDGSCSFFWEISAWLSTVKDCISHHALRRWRLPHARRFLGCSSEWLVSVRLFIIWIKLFLFTFHVFFTWLYTDLLNDLEKEHSLLFDRWHQSALQCFHLV